jgi:pyruvate kinase
MKISCTDLVQVGHRIVLDSGKLVFVVREKGNDYLLTEVIHTVDVITAS